MSYKIRHILLPMMTGLACAAVSCASDPDSGASAPVSQEAMQFEVRSGDTRTITTTNENISDHPFMLFGDINRGSATSKDIKPIFSRSEVKCMNKEKKIWNYGGATQYWFMGLEHSFVAIHPYIGEDDLQVSILTYEDSKLSFTYSLPKKLEEAKDLLFATHRRKYTLDNTGPIKLTFTHLLPRINISMALIEKEFMYDHVDENDAIGNPDGNKNEYIAVHSIEFQNIKTKASFTFTAVPLGSKTFTYDYEKSYLVRDDDRTETVVVTLENALVVPNSYNKDKEDDEQELEYETALKAEEIVVMLPQKFDDDSDAKIVVNYSINEDKDLTRRIVIPLAGTEWQEGKSYTYKFLIDNVYKGHIIDDGLVIVDIDDFRLHGDKEAGDDSWITDNDDKGHNISYGYDSDSQCGPL